jgi:alkyldihydroxyacetonephosphate synthase
VVTPAGVSDSRRLPGSGAGPSPDRLFLGSRRHPRRDPEAWLRLQERPRWQITASIAFETWPTAVAATRVIAQAGLHPSNCRLLDAEAFLSAGTTVAGGLLVVAFRVRQPSRRAVAGPGRGDRPGRRRHRRVAART